MGKSRMWCLGEREGVRTVYDLKPPAVFVHRRVLANERAVARMERMLAGLGNPEYEVVDINDTEGVVEAAGAREDLPVQSGRVRQGIEKLSADPVMLFNTFEWDPDKVRPPAREYRNPRARSIARHLAGTGREFAYSRRERADGSDPKRSYVCQGGWGIHTIEGCVHKCDYCTQSYFVAYMLDLEDFCVDLERNFQERPQQKLYRYDLKSDAICFEPEYGASELLGECFARHDRYMLIYTKSDNVEHLLDLPYKQHMPCYWTLATETQSNVIERDTPSLDERLAAMRQCQEAGYVVRAGFSPIIPHNNWRQEATEALEKLFAAATPDTVRLWVVSMMLAREAEQIFGADNLDPRFVEAMREAAPEMEGKHAGPFPPEARAEIYAHYIDEIRRISPDTPVNVCTEERQIWDMLAHKLDMRPDRLFCCCGQLSVPGSAAV
ncbi:spore photoproduct lyase family protein [Candidatus Latescibacterota bacterium]